MIEYKVTTEFIQGGGALKAVVVGPGEVRGVGYGSDEREAVDNAWRELWSKYEAQAA